MKPYSPFRKQWKAASSTKTPGCPPTSGTPGLHLISVHTAPPHLTLGSHGSRGPLLPGSPRTGQGGNCHIYTVGVKQGFAHSRRLTNGTGMDAKEELTHGASAESPGRSHRHRCATLTLPCHDAPGAVTVTPPAATVRPDSGLLAPAHTERSAPRKHPGTS